MHSREVWEHPRAHALRCPSLPLGEHTRMGTSPRMYIFLSSHLEEALISGTPCSQGVTYHIKPLALIFALLFMLHKACMQGHYQN
jgi:hypothetical protein